MPKQNNEVDFANRLDNMSKVDTYKSWMYSLCAPYIGKRVLEVGCGIGMFTTRFADDVEYALCVDVEQSVVDRHATRFESYPNIESKMLDISKDDRIEELQKLDFDTVFSINVLEHIEDDLAMLRSMQQMVKPGGNIVIGVPALSFLYSYMDENIGHFRRYDKNVLRQMGHMLDLECVCDRYFNFFGIPIFYLKGRKRNKKNANYSFTEMVDGNSSKIINWATVILRPLERIFPPPFGVSEIIVFRKRI